MMNHASVKRLDQIDLPDALLFGNKAAMLGRLARRGHPVPEGFALSADQLDGLLARNGFPYAPRDYLACSYEIRDCVRRYPLGPELSGVIGACVGDLRVRFPGARLIVRTSALCEDGRATSMAGMFESSTALGSVEEVEQAVLSCCASLFSDKALNAWATRAAGPLRAGIIIQRYVDGAVSGVTFTADAAEMDPDSVVISAVRGPCSALTGGEGSPTTYACRKGDPAAARVRGDGTVLADGWLPRLLRSAEEIEALGGCPQDIEWTIDADGLHVLQSRPITGLRRRTPQADWRIGPAAAADRVWTLRCGTCVPPLVGELVEAAAISAGTCAYERGMEWDSVTAAIINGYWYEARRPVPDQKGRIERYLAGIQRLFDEGEDEFSRNIRPELSALVERMHGLYVGRELSTRELLGYLDEAVHYMNRSAGLHWRAGSAEWYLGYFFRQRIGGFYDQIGAQDLVDMVYGRTTMIAEREELYRMAAYVRENEELRGLFDRHRHDAILEARLSRSRTRAARGLRDRLEEYGRAHGWEYCGNLEEGVLHRPGQIPLRECIGRLRRFLHVDIAAYRENLAHAAENARRLRESGYGRCRTEEERRAFRMAVAAGEKAFLAGDDHAHYICSRKFVYTCDVLRRIGDALAARRCLDKADDIHFLRLGEIRACLENGRTAQDLVARRKEEHLARCLLFPPATIGEAKQEQPPPADGGPAPSVTDVIKGQPGANRDARGRIRIGFPKDPPEEGVILLLEHGHEGDLTTILGRVKGIIMKGGTPACHMGIIARELGIPAVYGVGSQADALRDGDDVEIRGGTGEVVRTRTPAASRAPRFQ